MQKKTYGLIKIAYAKAISIPPVGAMVNKYKNSKAQKKEKAYADYLKSTFKDANQISLSDTNFRTVSLPKQEESPYLMGFDVLGYLKETDTARIKPLVDLLDTEKCDKQIACRIAVTDKALPEEEKDTLAGCNCYVLDPDTDYIFDYGKGKLAVVFVSESDIENKKPVAGLIKRIGYARENADYTVTYGINLNKTLTQKSMRYALANLDVSMVILSDGEAIDFDKPAGRMDGWFCHSIFNLGSCFGANAESGASAVARLKVIDSPVKGEFLLNKTYIPLYVNPEDESKNAIVLTYDKCKDDPALLAAYKYIASKTGTYHENGQDLTIGDMAEIISQKLPAEYSYMSNLSVGRFQTHWYELEYGDVMFFNEPYRDVNDVIDTPFEVRLRIVENAIKRGVSFVFSYADFDLDIPHVVIDNAMEAHITLSAAIRKQFPIKTVGITGSIGKTSTKDMLYNVLNEKFDTNRNLRNTNTQIHIGQHIQDFKPWHEMFIQEIGGGRVGGASRHSRMILPQAAVITNIGDAHIGNHGSREALMKNKLGIVDGLAEGGTLYLNGDDPLLSKAEVPGNVVFYGISNHQCDYYADNIVESDNKVRFDLFHNGQAVAVELNVLGRHNVLNAVCCFAIAKQFDLTDEEIKAGLLKFKTSGVRQNMINVAGYNLFVDCFNASPDSIDSSLSVLDSVECKGKKIAVVGDVTGAAGMAKELHENIGDIVKNHEMDILICYGKNSQIVYNKAKAAGKNAYHFTKPKVLEAYLKEIMNVDDVILFKGSSKMKLAQSIDSIFGTMLAEQLYTDSVKIKQVNADGINYNVCPSFATVAGVANPESVTSVSVASKLKRKEVLNIGQGAFADCRILTDVKFNHNLRHIADEAFSGCSSLSEITLPPTVKFIGDNAFAGCSSLKKIVVPELTHIGTGVFDGCPDLVVECKAGSVVEAYCMENNIKVIKK